jgi:DMSO/TMAO reductase YedYZ molybdopterin-dependent catalytic subunit
MPVVVYEFVTHAVDPANAAPQQLTPRAKLWRVLVPPDQLNPLGWTDADLEAFMPTQV